MFDQILLIIAPSEPSHPMCTTMKPFALKDSSLLIWSKLVQHFYRRMIIVHTSLWWGLNTFDKIGSTTTWTGSFSLKINIKSVFIMPDKDIYKYKQFVLSLKTAPLPGNNNTNSLCANNFHYLQSMYKVACI